MNSQERLDECRTDAALYALGALAPHEANRFEDRLKSGCPFCIAEAEQFAQVADYLAGSVPPQQPPASLRDRVLDRIAASGQAHAPAKEPLPPQKTIVRGGDARWVRLPVPGIEVRPLLGQDTVLVRMKPGAVYPFHVHQKSEQCYVLDGSVTDSDGLTAYAGDFVCMPAGTEHRPIHSDDGCLFLITYT